MGRVARWIENTIDGPASVDYDMRLLGGESFMFFPEQQLAGFWSLQAINRTTGLVRLLVSGMCGATSGHHDLPVWGPCPEDILRVNFDTAGAHKYKLAVVEGIVAAGGSVVVDAGSAVIAAATTLARLTTIHQVLVRGWHGVLRGTQTGELRLGLGANAITVDDMPLCPVTVAATTSAPGHVRVIAPQMTLGVRNTDAALPGTYTWVVMGYLGSL